MHKYEDKIPESDNDASISGTDWNHQMFIKFILTLS